MHYYQSLVKINQTGRKRKISFDSQGGGQWLRLWLWIRSSKGAVAVGVAVESFSHVNRIFYMFLSVFLTLSTCLLPLPRSIWYYLPCSGPCSLPTYLS